MAGFIDRPDIIGDTNIGKIITYGFAKVAPQSAEGTGVWATLWKGTGRPGAGADPATTPGTVYTSDDSAVTAGAIQFGDRSTDQKYLYKFGAVASQNCSLMLYDRLSGVSGLLTTTTGSKTASTGALDRYTGTAADKNQVWIEFTAATNTTAPILNLNSYTTADGSTAQAGGSVTMPATVTDIGTLMQMPLDATKTGVRSVETINVGTASASTGTFNLLIIRPLAIIPLIATVPNEVNYLDQIMTLPRIYDNATLGLALLASTTTAVTCAGQVSIFYG